MKATDGSKALRFKYDFSNGGWYDVAKYLDGANWSGESVLASKLRGMVPTTPSACRLAQAMANTSSPASNLTSPAGSRLRFHWSITPI
nr:carbohydrate binding domain-containing protein [Bifidobacterium adolescentis]